uniref:isopentenyl-diphosphate Delta-isomerase n=1 Tax=Angiostrongylus cantonensis TaxID=6313 RepID=A0A158PAP6_ANGCA
LDFTVTARQCSINNTERMQRANVILPKYDPVQVGYLSEKCIAVDEDDQIIGEVTKMDAHRVETCITFPCLWANTCCSHPLFTAGERTGATGVIAAVVRKIEHELGFVDLEPEECHVMGRFLYKAVEANSLWGEHELDYAVVTRNVSLDRLVPNPQEVSDIRAVDEKELTDWITSESPSFSPWFRLFYRLRFLSEWWSNIDHIENLPVDLSIIRMT